MKLFSPANCHLRTQPSIWNAFNWSIYFNLVICYPENWQCFMLLCNKYKSNKCNWYLIHICKYLQIFDQIFTKYSSQTITFDLFLCNSNYQLVVSPTSRYGCTIAIVRYQFSSSPGVRVSCACITAVSLNFTIKTRHKIFFITRTFYACCHSVYSQVGELTSMVLLNWVGFNQLLLP